LLVKGGDGEVAVNLRTAQAEVGQVVTKSFVDLFGKRKDAKPSAAEERTVFPPGQDAPSGSPSGARK
jgi:hypothetical protein